MSIISGKNIKVRYGVGPTAHKITSFSIDDEAEEIETTNSESNGFYESEDAGISVATIRLDGDYNVGAAPLAAFTPGALVTPLLIYLSGIGGQPEYVFANFRVMRATTGAEIKGKVKFSVTGKAHGSYTRPTT